MTVCAASTASVPRVHITLPAISSLTGKMRLSYPDRPYLNEFEMETEIDADRIIDALAAEGILAGVATAPRRLLIAVTEMRTPQEIDRYIETVKALQS